LNTEHRTPNAEHRSINILNTEHRSINILNAEHRSIDIFISNIDL